MRATIVVVKHQTAQVGARLARRKPGLDCPCGAFSGGAAGGNPDLSL